QYHKEIYDLMTIDGLTGVSNKRHYNDTLASELSRPGAQAEPVSVIVFDVDHFKRINDTLGHAAGDAVLRRLAATARGAVPQQHLVGRVGGEEFAVMLLNCDQAPALAIAEQLRAAVQAQLFQFQNQVIPVTISVGVATRAIGQQEAPLELFKRADEALYRAKQSGRNRVCT
ncbi:MAG: GGDEF domain-containing protein, partial [Myxococcales bacterium]|nr:GGDEF domain-containing protein [Myxococcales bacterium]